MGRSEDSDMSKRRLDLCQDVLLSSSACQVSDLPRECSRALKSGIGSCTAEHVRRGHLQYEVDAVEDEPAGESATTGTGAPATTCSITVIEGSTPRVIPTISKVGLIVPARCRRNSDGIPHEDHRIARPHRSLVLQVLA